MRRTILLSTTLLVFAVAFMVTPALAQSPHFVGTPSCSVNSSGNTVMVESCGTISGLGNATDWVTITGTAPITCKSSGKGGTQTTSAHQFSGTTAVRSTTNGNFQFCTTATISCPGNQTASFTGTPFQATDTLSSGPNGSGNVFDTATVTCQ